MRFEVLKRDGFACHYCGRRAPDVVLHVDHIEPVAAGGETTLENLVASCAECNLAKSDRPLMAVPPCAFCGQERAGMFFELPDAEHALICIECIRYSIYSFQYVLRPRTIACCGCGRIYENPPVPWEGKTHALEFKPTDIVVGDPAWVCADCYIADGRTPTVKSFLPLFEQPPKWEPRDA
jgi:hypothetical protein